MTERSPYDHRYHAANHGDVWKHTAWLAVLAALKRERLAVLDTHAGRGDYALPARGGEWTSGLGRLRELHREGSSTGSGAVDRYLAKIARADRYPGSPLLALQSMGRSDRLTAYEQDPEAARALRALLAGDSRAKVVEG